MISLQCYIFPFIKIGIKILRDSFSGMQYKCLDKYISIQVTHGVDKNANKTKNICILTNGNLIEI